MKKKLFIGIAMSLFAVATVFNMNLSEKSNAGNLSLDAIAVMAEAQDESSDYDCYPCGWVCTVMHEDGYPLAIQGRDNYGQ